MVWLNVMLKYVTDEHTTKGIRLNYFYTEKHEKAQQIIIGPPSSFTVVTVYLGGGGVVTVFGGRLT